MVKVVPQNERFLAADDSRALQFGGDAVGGKSRTQHHEGLSGGRDGQQNGPGEPSGSSEDCNQNQPENFAHDNDSLDDEESLVAGDVRSGLYFSKYLIRLKESVARALLPARVGGVGKASRSARST